MALFVRMHRHAAVFILYSKKMNLPVFDATLMVKFLQRIYGRIENED